jgi:AcrR family transcriptional regulator
MAISFSRWCSGSPGCVIKAESEHHSVYTEQRSDLASGIVVSDKTEDQGNGSGPRSRTDQRVRADAQRNLDALLQAAKMVFATSGVDAPVREIAEKAGVGVATLYRHFPQRADLVAAVFRREMDACADAAPILAAEYEPFEALVKWMQRYATFVATKRGLAKALHSGDPVFDTLPGYFDQRLRPAFRALLVVAAAAGEVRADVDADELLGAVASLCMSVHNDGPGRTERMVALLVDGLRYGTNHR